MLLLFLFIFSLSHQENRKIINHRNKNKTCHLVLRYATFERAQIRLNKCIKLFHKAAFHMENLN